MYSNGKATMAGERTPLLQTVVIAPQRQRYTHSTVRRFCSVALASTLFVVVILFLLPTQWLPGGKDGMSVYFPGRSPLPHAAWPQNEGLAYKELQDLLQTTPQEDKAREWSQYYTAGPHLAGKNFSQALWTRERWQEFGVQDTNIVSYDVYVNYPAGHRLALLEKSSKSRRIPGERVAETDSISDYKVKYECSMTEDVLDEDPTSGLADRIPTFHGYSANGNVSAQFVYVNFGTYQDFEDLVKANVSLEGKIAIAKYGRIFRGLKVKRAQELGMVGTVIYTDPQEDGEVTEENGYKIYPDGPARNPSSVQRGSVQFLSKPGWKAQNLKLANDCRCSSWRSHNSWLSLQARRSSPGGWPCHSQYPFGSHLLHRCASDSESPERPWSKGIRLQQILARRWPRI